MDRKSIEYGIGFADSELVSYASENQNLIILLKSWNNKIIKFEFNDRLFLLIRNLGYVSDVCEVSNLVILDKLPTKKYKVSIKDASYRFFQFLDLDDDPIIEVVCKNINISTKEIN